ncbi:MAG: AAA family ATPase [Oscillibacter sp.]|nr:AAA family ATPase [Oscillibacter sp.]
MKLEVKNIGLIREAEIELDGVTVLAGFNGTGKSTISKALYGIMAGYKDLQRRIEEERIRSVNTIIDSFFLEHTAILPSIKYSYLSTDIVRKLVPVPETFSELLSCLNDGVKDSYAYNENYFESIYSPYAQKLRAVVDRPDKEYARFILNRDINRLFEGQTNTLDSPTSGEISLTRRETTIFLRIENRKVVSCSDCLFAVTTPVYLEPRHMLDAFGTESGEREGRPYDFPLYTLLMGQDSPIYLDRDTPTYEQTAVRERVSNLIDSIIHGGLVKQVSSSEFQFKDARFGEPVAVRNMASGSKTLAVLRRLVEQGTLRENGVLIIDEPENNLHPEWQIKLAQVLVMLQNELNLRILLNTHSTYFLRGIEVSSRKYGLADKCHYYKTEPAEDGLFRTVCVDGNTNEIYHEFYLPFEELDIPED